MDHCVTRFQPTYLDIENQVGTRGLQYAADKGLAVVIMEPLRGGALARNISPAVQVVWDSVGATPRGRPGAGTGPSPYKRTHSDWAVQWLCTQPEVPLVLTGMSTASGRRAL